jgi:signal peptidase I
MTCLETTASFVPNTPLFPSHNASMASFPPLDAFAHGGAQGQPSVAMPHLPLCEALEIALLKATQWCVDAQMPLSDTAWILGALIGADDQFSTLTCWWRALGLQKPAQQQIISTLKTVLLQKRSEENPNNQTNPLYRKALNTAGRFALSLIFLDFPPDRETLEAFHPNSKLWLNANYIAHQRQGTHIEWEDWLQAMAYLDLPQWRPLLASVDLAPATLVSAKARVKRTHAPRMLGFFTKELVQFVVTVSLALILLRQGLFEPRLIPSESMLPRLQVEDRIAIEKMSHWVRPYQRGDVLVFYPPQTTLKYDFWSLYLRATGFSGFYPKEANIDVAYIKRLVGLPGDRIEVRPNDGVYINGGRLDEPYVAEVAQSCTKMDEATYQPLWCGVVVVPKDSYFMMGDNRNHSLDSRFWGFLPAGRVIGRAWVRFWPLERFGWVE